MDIFASCELTIWNIFKESDMKITRCEIYVMCPDEGGDAENTRLD